MEGNFSYKGFLSRETAAKKSQVLIRQWGPQSLKHRGPPCHYHFPLNCSNPTQFYSAEKPSATSLLFLLCLSSGVTRRQRSQEVSFPPLPAGASDQKTTFPSGQPWHHTTTLKSLCCLSDGFRRRHYQ